MKRIKCRTAYGRQVRACLEEVIGNLCLTYKVWSYQHGDNLAFVTKLKTIKGAPKMKAGNYDFVNKSIKITNS
jgi:hypothetical protein